MMEKLSAKEFDENFEIVNSKFENALKVAKKTKDEVMFLAATKTVDIDTINYAISKGITYVGENKVQELLQKHDSLVEVHEHFIGHLQTNKVKDVIDKVELIQSVDSIKLAKEISKQAIKRNIVMDILLEVNIGGEDSKWGFKPEDAEKAIRAIIEERMDLEQFAECDITMVDLTKIRMALVNTLSGVYHHRVKYPSIKYKHTAGGMKGEHV